MIVAVLAMLITLITPSYVSALNLARRTNCASRLKSIGAGYSQYAGAYQGWFPVVGASGGLGHDLTVVGVDPEDDNDTVSEPGQGRALFKLLREGFAQWKHFSCPSDAGVMFEKSFDAGVNYDFPVISAGHPWSYAFQVSVYDMTSPTRAWLPSSTANPELILSADMNPMFKWKWNAGGDYWSGDPIGTIDATVINNDQYIKSFEMNHAKGQNVLHMSGGVSFKNFINIGPKGDIIYTYDDGSEFGAVKEDATPKNGRDSYLIP
jgi:hypothetical protein